MIVGVVYLEAELAPAHDSAKALAAAVNGLQLANVLAIR
jgi:predicted MFS family arabinose efflux permease